MNNMTMCYGLTFLIFLSYSAYGQEELKVAGLGTTFIVIGSLGDNIKKDKCPCSVPSRGKCSLYEFKINKILYYFDNHAFSKDELKRVDKILVKKSIKLEREKEYILALQPGTSKLYIQYTDTLSINPQLNYKIIHRDGYVTDLITCEGRRDRFEQFLLSK